MLSPRVRVTLATLALSLSACFVNGGQPYARSDQARPFEELAGLACQRGDLKAYETLAARSTEPVSPCVDATSRTSSVEHQDRTAP
ncbi:hypothetical protein DL240_09385 [Lujinxingia litoralis]|uniref:Ankyrin repeat domain-containing protein n=1 Tax=Lujinxingia litoralis TaxID=2211119 RepID=A0A328C8C2_9DELT|nr:hypothetical protein [Lujinxingia litoralis]RAL23088.1 hypothetical protein DL240_09385 [Lujinxingia litoralis]